MTVEPGSPGTIPAGIADRITRLVKLGWGFTSSLDPDKTYRSRRVFARKDGSRSGVRGDTFQWIGTQSYERSWEYVVSKVEDIEGLFDKELPDVPSQVQVKFREFL